MNRYTLYVIRYTLMLVILTNLMGCDAFIRKFTRKPKKENITREEMVLAPEEYKNPQMTKEELYRQYFLFWKSWHSELIDALAEDGSHKKQLDCLSEAIKNLNDLKNLLVEDKQMKLESYISQLKDLQGEIKNDLYGNATSGYLLNAESIKRNILKDFAYHKIKNSLK